MASAPNSLALVQEFGHRELQQRLGKIVLSWVALNPDRTAVYRRDNQ